MTEQLYFLKIKLLEIEPEIWRRFTVPSDISLDRLHDVIQIVMGWTDSHLHEFTIGKKRYTEFPESKSDGLESGGYRLGDLVKQKGRSFLYCYDFGDNWEHEIIFEEKDFLNPETESPIECIDGERACPLEDVGGAPGHMEFCKALKDPGHEAHEDVMEWSGGDYDSDEFDIDEINWELVKYLRWSRERRLPWKKSNVPV